jgi:3',5'-cyclic AMP phosphodiesterase CpdA
MTRKAALKYRLGIYLVCIAAFLGGCTSGAPSPEEVQCEGDPGLPVLNGPDNPEHLRFVAVGDAGEAGDILTATVEDIRALADPGPDAILLLGDNAYKCGFRDNNDPLWDEVIGPLIEIGKPIYPVLGNHDWGRKAQLRCWLKPATNPHAEIEKSGTAGYENWIFPDNNYVLRTRLAEIIFFDSTPIVRRWEGEFQRSLCAVRKALAETKSTPWRIVVAHHPIYSSPRDRNGEEQRMLDAIEAELEKGGVDLFLSGHDHHLEIFNKAEASRLYVVSGAGAKSEDVGRDADNLKNVRVSGGFAIIDMDTNKLSVKLHCNGKQKPCLQKEWEQGSR